MRYHRILVSALFVGMSSLLPSCISKKYFLLSLVYIYIYILAMNVITKCKKNNYSLPHAR